MMLVGLPASGKSVYANKTASLQNAIVYSSDKMREELFGDVNEQDRNKELFTEMHRRIKQSLEAASRISQVTDNYNLYLAALCHDIGKGIVKNYRYHEDKGVYIAHYYQHHLVSAYESMFYLKNICIDNFNDFLEILALITRHMQPYNIKTDKTENRFKSLVGRRLYNEVMALNVVDRLAK